MNGSAKSYGDLLAERNGKGFSEQKLIKVLCEILPELEALHAKRQAHGFISPQTLVLNSDTQQTTLMPPPAQPPWDHASTSRDLFDLGTTIIILFTGKPLMALKGPDGILRWQDDRLVSDNFANVINKATARTPVLRYSSAIAMLQDLDEQGGPDVIPPMKNKVTHGIQAHVYDQVSSTHPPASLLPGTRAAFSAPLRTAAASIRQKTSQNQRFSVLLGAALLGGVLTVLAWFSYLHLHPKTQIAYGTSELSGNQNENPITSPPQIPAGHTSAAQVTFSGIDLPITNKLCTNRGNFCIYNLAALINQESGEATYSFSETVEGQSVKINGKISIANLQKESGRRLFTFAFRDDQNNTSQGWAAAGSFRLDQDTTRPGILTRFKTLESFGPKTPLGLENTAYVFPR